MNFSSFFNLNFRQGTASPSISCITFCKVMNISKATSSCTSIVMPSENILQPRLSSNLLISCLNPNFPNASSSKSMFALNLPVMNLSLSSSSLDLMRNPYSDFLALYGCGADDLVVGRGGDGAPSV